MFLDNNKEYHISQLLHKTETFINNFKQKKGLIDSDLYCNSCIDNSIESYTEYKNENDIEKNMMSKNNYLCINCQNIIKLTSVYDFKVGDVLEVSGEFFKIEKDKYNSYRIKSNKNKNDLTNRLTNAKLSKKMLYINCSPNMCNLINTWIIELLYNFRIVRNIEYIFACSNNVYRIMDDIESLENINTKYLEKPFIIKQIFQQICLYLNTLKKNYFTQHPDFVSIGFDIKDTGIIYKDKEYNFDIQVLFYDLKYSGLTIDTGNKKVRIFSNSNLSRLENNHFGKKKTLNHNSSRFGRYFSPSKSIDNITQNEIPYYGTSLTLYSYFIYLIKHETIKNTILNNEELFNFWKSLWFKEEYNQIMNEINKNIPTSVILSKYHIMDPIEYIKLTDHFF